MIIWLYIYCYDPGVDKCFVPSDVLNEKAQSRGLETSQITQYGLPIRQGFWSKPSSGSKASSTLQDATAYRQDLGIDDLPTVLVVGGGDLDFTRSASIVQS